MFAKLVLFTHKTRFASKGYRYFSAQAKQGAQ